MWGRESPVAPAEISSYAVLTEPRVKVASGAWGRTDSPQLGEDDVLGPVRGPLGVDGVLLDEHVPTRGAYIEDGVHLLVALEMQRAADGVHGGAAELARAGRGCTGPFSATSWATSCERTPTTTCEYVGLLLENTTQRPMAVAASAGERPVRSSIATSFPFTKLRSPITINVRAVE